MNFSLRSLPGLATLTLVLVTGCAVDSSSVDNTDNTANADLKNSTAIKQSDTACTASTYNACIAKNGKGAVICADSCPSNCFNEMSKCLGGGSDGGYACAKRCKSTTPPPDATMCDAGQFDNCYDPDGTPDQKSACAKFCPKACRAAVAKCLREEGGGITCARRDCNSSI